jgi:hypothetical protein
MIGRLSDLPRTSVQGASTATPPTPRLPTPPPGYQAPTAREGRLTDLGHNRRLGWLLRLVDAGVPLDDILTADIQARVDFVRRLLPDVFPPGVDAAAYVANLNDLEIARGIYRRTTKSTDNG